MWKSFINRQAVQEKAMPVRKRPLDIMVLEPRLMFDGAAVATAAHAAVDASTKALIPTVAAPVEVRAADPTKDNGKVEVAFVDTSVSNYQTLEAGIRAGVAIVEINGGESGLAQIATWAETHSGYDAIHVLSHGTEATLTIGSDNVTDASLSTPVAQAELAEIGSALKPGGELLLYGCDVAKGSDGQQFINDLAANTGAVVAASTNATGTAAYGGDWVLEASTGAISVPTLSVANYDAVLATTIFNSGTLTTGSQFHSPDISQWPGSTVDYVYTSADLSGGFDYNIDATNSYSYSVVKFTPSSSGAFDIFISSASLQTVDASSTKDTVMFIYAGSFDPANPGQNMIYANDDSVNTVSQNSPVGSSDYESKVTGASLTGGSDYYIVITSLLPGVHGTFSLTIDGPSGGTLVQTTTSAPTQTVTINSLSADTGTSASDFVTKTASQTINATLSGALGGTDILYGSVDGGTTWTNITSKVSGTAISWDGVTLSGTSSIEFKVTDAAGNDGTVATHAYTLDTTAPAQTVTINNLSADTGTSATDFVTKTASQTISATLSGALGGTDILYGSVDGGSTWTDITSKVSGTAVTWNGATLSGTGSIEFKVTDAAGNDGAVVTHAYTLDITAPAQTVNINSLSADTGTSASDFVTKTASQTINATLSSTLGGSDILYGSVDGGSTWTDITSKVSGTTVTWNGATLSGASPIEFKVTDAAGNDGTVATHAYTLDTTAPAQTVTINSLSADTGTSATDFVTKTASQTISATLSSALGGSDILYGSVDGGTTWTDITSKVSGTTVTWNGATLSGTSPIEFKVTDAAGNDGTVAAHAYTLDTTAPTIAAVTVDATAYGLGATVTATVTTGAYDSNGAYTLASSTLDGATLTGWTYDTATHSGTATFTVTGATSEVINGNLPVHIVVADAAGNSSTAYTTAIAGKTIDTHAPTAVGMTGFTLSSGTLNGNAALVANSTVGTLSTTDASSGDSYIYALGGVDAGKFQVVGGVLQVANGITLVDGTVYNITVQSTDLGGNTLGSAQAVAITGVSAPVVSSIHNDTNTATHLVKASSESFTVTFSAAVSGVAAGNFTLSGTDGTGTIGTPTSSDGGITWTVPVTGISGNGTLGLDLGSVGGIVAVSNSVSLVGTHVSDQTYTIDTTAPAAPVLSGLTAGTDTGSSQTDGITNNTTPTVTGTAEANSTVTVLIDGNAIGTATADSNGAWTYAIGPALVAGNHNITATATDAVGNVGAASGTYVISIDTAASTPVVGGLTTGTDTGSSHTDGITNNTTPTITGTVEANSTVTVLIDGNAVGTATANASGVWTYAVTGALAQGSHTVTCTITDPAGNNSVASSAYTVTVDTTAPSAPSLAATNVSGTQSVSVTGHAENNATIVVRDGNAVLSTVVANAQGDWSWSGSLPYGTHSINATASDTAGNTSSAGQSVSLVMVAPTVVTTSPVVVSPTTSQPAVVSPPATLAELAPPVDTRSATMVTAVSTDPTPTNANPPLIIVQAPIPTQSQSQSPVNYTNILSTPTSIGGVQVVVMSDATQAGGNTIVAAKPIGEVDAVNGQVNFTVPADAFAVNNANTRVTLTATRDNGQPLPSWLTFDSKSGRFVGTAPPGEKVVEVKVTAHDSNGHDATQVFKINPNGGGAQGRLGALEVGHGKTAQLGRPGLAAQLAAHGREGHLAQQMALLGALRSGGKAA